MRKTFISAVILFCTLPISRTAHADGCYLPRESDWNVHRERAYINEPEQKATILFHQGIEDLIISPSFAGAPSEFAWVVPVPAPPKVRIVEGALFHELARLAFPRPPIPSAAFSEKSMAGAASRVTVLERKEVGDYDVSVLAASDSNSLMQWLKTNGYHLPPKAAVPVEAYVAEKWTFVACRIRNGSTAAGLQTGTLAPLRLTFNTERPMYPMRLSSANPGPFHVLIYLVIPATEVSESVGVLQPILPPDDPSLQKGAPRRAEVDEGQSEFPTLAALSREALRVFAEDAEYVQPESCTRDLTWTIDVGGPVTRQEVSTLEKPLPPYSTTPTPNTGAPSGEDRPGVPELGLRISGTGALILIGMLVGGALVGLGVMVGRSRP